MGTTKRGRKSKHHRLPPRRPLMQHPGAGEPLESDREAPRRPPMQHPGAGEPLESDGEGKEDSRGDRGNIGEAK
ncbi:hypothetical protein AXF42_Ash014890 [Apostasia shenzhenica]|uniref:Uncharacterized protein n=1 Tax=Apostasia shenzhenica TaxID=1088818 RepID=A0A2I0ALG3_9ASPA|nr:hypothetical protein AXF42_Ash014890 [Apostasia shenzhenica]